MTGRDTKMTGEEERKKGHLDWLKAVGYAVLAVAVVAAVVLGIQQLRIR